MLLVPPPFVRGRTSAFPLVQTTATDFKTANLTNTYNLPAGIVAGDLMLFFARYSPNITLTFPGGWNLLFNANDGNNVITGGCWFKIAASGETTISITASATTAIATIAYRISGYVGTPQAATTNGTTGNADPPNLAPTWGTKKTLWIIHEFHGAPAAATPPANYTNVIAGPNTQSNAAQRNLEAASENPGAWTVSGQGWRASTVAVQGT
jgi:hypothetical protein